jgi:2-oxoglutarate dehydrogenase complex dehydrogenase (E1) component-like enzyme
MLVKTFFFRGGESLIPGLNALMKLLPAEKIARTFRNGMYTCGRLNNDNNILQPTQDIFSGLNKITIKNILMAM